MVFNFSGLLLPMTDINVIVSCGGLFCCSAMCIRDWDLAVWCDGIGATKRKWRTSHPLVRHNTPSVVHVLLPCLTEKRLRYVLALLYYIYFFLFVLGRSSSSSSLFSISSFLYILYISFFTGSAPPPSSYRRLLRQFAVSFHIYIYRENL